MRRALLLAIFAPALAAASVPIEAPRETIAESARAIYDGFKSVFTWPFGAPAYAR